MAASVCLCVCESGDDSGVCVFVLMLADRAKLCTWANNLQDGSNEEDKQTHAGGGVWINVSPLELRVFAVIMSRREMSRKVLTDGAMENAGLKLVKMEKRNEGNERARVILNWGSGLGGAGGWK